MKWPWQKQKTIKEFSDYEIVDEYRNREIRIRDDVKRQSSVKFAQNIISAVEDDLNSVDIEICHERTTPMTAAYLVKFKVRRQ